MNLLNSIMKRVSYTILDKRQKRGEKRFSIQEIRGEKFKTNRGLFINNTQCPKTAEQSLNNS